MSKLIKLSLLLIFVGLSQIGSTNSFFVDDATSSNNVLTAWTPTPSEKITICHVAGRMDEPANYITLEISFEALKGHFYENGTPRAGHEEDHMGPCKTPEPFVASESVVEPTESPTPTETPTPEPSPTPENQITGE